MHFLYAKFHADISPIGNNNLRFFVYNKFIFIYNNLIFFILGGHDGF